jgi:non-structural maintenance of chromosomes element 4
VRSRSTTAASKRKRADTNTNDGPTSSRRRTLSPSPSPSPPNASGLDADKTYDPNQSMEQRRDIQRQLRDLGRNLQENADDYLKDDATGLRELLLQANEVNKNVKQTTEAVIDSRFLVSAADLSYKRTALITQGNHALGVDADEFVSKCLAYMLRGDENADDNATQVTSTQRRNRQRAARGVEGADDDSDDESGDMLNWAYLGRYGCLPNIGRASLAGHLLGPLSVEKKVRKITQRTARFRPNALEEVRPEVIKADDLAKVENDMAKICRGVLDRLNEVQAEVQGECEKAFDKSNDEGIAKMQELGLRSTGGLDLLRFVINPKSFGQSVENMFYVSFLIRDGKVKVELDEDGIPSIRKFLLYATYRMKLVNFHAEAFECEDDEDADGRDADRHATKHQAVFQLDMRTWRDIVQTLKIREPMIAHRQEGHAQGPSASGWYT